MAAAAPEVLALQAGPLRLALRPDLGGCIAGLWHQATPVLVSVDPATLTSAWPSGCYVLVPYSNRLGERRFRWAGQDHELALNNPLGAHAMHGVAWARRWQVLSASNTDAELAYHHQPDADWPYAFTARQHLVLAPGRLLLQLSLHNTDARAQPGGLGWHPYFPKRAGSRLQVALTHRWASDPATELPTHRVPQRPLDGDVAQLDVDHCFEGWPGVAQLQDSALSITLRSSLSRLVIYTPPHKDFFCVEPVSHVNNALNMADPLANGVQHLSPGETMQASLQLDIAAL